MSYQPKHQRQLNGTSTASADCWVRAVSMAVDFATKGAQVPTVTAIRNRAGVPAGSGTTADQEKAVESYDTSAETGKRKPLVFDRRVGRPWAEFVAPLENGNKAVVLSIDYGVVNDKRPGLSGDPNFDGGHSVMFLGSRETANGGIEVKCWDSLYDGRRTSIPKGPQWWPLWLAKDAAAEFAKAAGAGKATGGVIPVSPLLAPPAPPPDPEPEPEPDPPDLPTREQEMEDALNEERAALVDFIARAHERIAVLDRINPPNTQQATAIVESGQGQEEA